LVVNRLPVPTTVDQDFCGRELAVGRCLMQCSAIVRSAHIDRSLIGCEHLQFGKIAYSSRFKDIAWLCGRHDCERWKKQQS
jgi:hypothetical protein